MNGFIAGLARLVVRLVLLVAGLAFAAALFAALLVFVLLWILGAGFARLTGKPVSPFVMKFNVQRGFGRVYNTESSWARPREPQPVEARREIADVTDVEPKEPRG